MNSNSNQASKPLDSNNNMQGADTMGNRTKLSDNLDRMYYRAGDQQQQDFGRDGQRNFDSRATGQPRDDSDLDPCRDQDLSENGPHGSKK